MSIVDSQQQNEYYNKVYQQLLFVYRIKEWTWENGKYEDEKHTLIDWEIMSQMLGAS